MESGESSEATQQPPLPDAASEAPSQEAARGLVPKGTRALAWIALASAAICALLLFGNFGDARAMYLGGTRMLFFLGHGVAMSTAPRRAGLVVDAAILVTWGVAHLVFGTAGLLGIAHSGESVARASRFGGPLFRGALSTAFGVAILRRHPIARGWAWPLLSLFQPGLSAPVGDILLLVVAIGVTRYVRRRPEFRRSSH